MAAGRAETGRRREGGRRAGRLAPGRAFVYSSAAYPGLALLTSLLTTLLLSFVMMTLFHLWDLPGDVLAAPESASGLDRCNLSLSLSLSDLGSARNPVPGRESERESEGEVLHPVTVPHRRPCHSGAPEAVLSGWNSSLSRGATGISGGRFHNKSPGPPTLLRLLRPRPPSRPGPSQPPARQLRATTPAPPRRPPAALPPVAPGCPQGTRFLGRAAGASARRRGRRRWPARPATTPADGRDQRCQVAASSAVLQFPLDALRHGFLQPVRHNGSAAGWETSSGARECRVHPRWRHLPECRMRLAGSTSADSAGSTT